ncbi:MAG: NAD-dependent dehydratase, partial [Moraxellaceae bacterium]
MKIILTGSLGHISKPLAAQLIQNGHDVSIISSIKDRREDITKLGAKPIIGSLEDAKFVTDAFFGADAVYTMVPPNDYTNPNLDLLAYYEQLGHNYAHAIKANSIKRVVNLSSIGAHLEHGSGILLGAHRVEQILDAVSQGVAITHIRPTSFYYNLFAYIPSIRQANVIAVNHGESHTLSWVAPIDIADAVAAELQ